MSLSGQNNPAPEASGHPVGWRSRGIPWPAVIRFHKEIAARAEQSFFSLYAKDDQAERWSSLLDYAPEEISGPWRIPRESIASYPFRLALDQGGQESVFLGGPCFVGWEKGERGVWIASWRPLFYREVEVRAANGAYEISPKQGAWSLTPLIYGLLNQVQVDTGAPLDVLANRIMAKAAAYRNDAATPWNVALAKATASIVPELESVISRELRTGDVPVQPTPWLLFAPTTKFSALTRYLMQDYEKMEARLTKSPSAIGGLRLLDAEIPPAPIAATDLLPVVPLNNLQLEAVQSVLGNQPLTVISGPPGCGKSQVVVSVLLNAWARGTSVLFASNNNKAVDVVRERLEKFEAEFPIAVRAGNREKNNIIEVLRRTLNMAAGSFAANTVTDPTQLRQRRDELLFERARLQQHLESHLPQRTSEALKTALRGYGACKMKRAELAQQETALLDATAKLGLPGFSSAQIESLLDASQRWLRSVAKHRQQVQTESVERDQLRSEASLRGRVRDQAVSAVGLEASQLEDWTWLTDGPQTSQLDAWETQLKALLEEPLEVALEPYHWQEEFNRWVSNEDAAKSAQLARAFSEEIRRATAELAPKVNKISSGEKALREHASKLAELGLEERDDLRLEVLQAWSSGYAELSTRQKSFWDFLPWTPAGKLSRHLETQERLMRDWVPLGKWQQVGTLNDEGRSRLATTVESLRRYVQNRMAWQNLEPERSEVESILQRLRATAGLLNLENIPAEADPDLWRGVIKSCDVLSVKGTAASEAWRRRTAAESATKRLANLAREWTTFASGQPLKISWATHIGRKLDLDVAAVLEEPTPAKVVALRSSYYSGALSRLRAAWVEAFNEEASRRSLLTKAAKLPSESDHIATVWSQAPQANPNTATANESEWPDTGAWENCLIGLRELHGQWQTFHDKTKPTALREAEEEAKWSVTQLAKAVELLPEQGRSAELSAQLSAIENNPSVDWPVEALNAAFAEVSPDRFRARIEQINAQLQKRSFEDAKAEWLERLQKEKEGIQAVDSLEKTLRRNHGELPEGDLPLFQKALPLVPIWITTAQAAQAIPLHPELFDLVIIDEASQCTLTNLLPLLYRGKRLAIIGDAEQLPAIPTIQGLEEKALATKHNILEHLNLVGHAGNDVYKTATESLPRRRADVLQLNEHFRSNPQIIGFSNRHIYLQRLILKKDPTRTAALPVGSGVHRIHVTGAAEQGPRGRSWVNQAEGNAVLDLITKLRSTPVAKDRSLGVVTSFAAHKDWLREKIQERGLSSEVLVDSAYGFQGDERDIMIFSPVVARGITSSASRWVESPPNLVNVALTRAKEALYVVADFDYCLQQEGILRKLALYCRDIQLLRDTSPAELELYSWMIVQGWTPKIHPRIGDVEADFELTADSGQKLAIEVDGGGEDHWGRKEQDKARDAFLHAQGYIVLRFPARAVLETPFEVVTVIGKNLKS